MQMARLQLIKRNAENMDLSRISHPTEKDFVRLKDYEKVREILLEENDAKADK